VLVLGHLPLASGADPSGQVVSCCDVTGGHLPLASGAELSGHTFVDGGRALLGGGVGVLLGGETLATRSHPRTHSRSEQLLGGLVLVHVVQ
jgi:hypothetical protein